MLLFSFSRLSLKRVFARREETTDYHGGSTLGDRHAEEGKVHGRRRENREKRDNEAKTDALSFFFLFFFRFLKEERAHFFSFSSSLKKKKERKKIGRRERNLLFLFWPNLSFPNKCAPSPCSLRRRLRRPRRRRRRRFREASPDSLRLRPRCRRRRRRRHWRRRRRGTPLVVARLLLGRRRQR